MGKLSFKIKCRVQLQMICVPHSKLCKFDHIYLNVEMFGETKRSKLMHPCFPITSKDDFHFEKVLWSPQSKKEAFKLLKESPVSVELRLLKADSTDSVLLAYTDTNAYEFLISGTKEDRDSFKVDRNLDLAQTEHHCALSPKVKLICDSTITSSGTPMIDTFLDYYSSNCIGCEIERLKKSFSPQGGHSICCHGEMYSCNCDLHKKENKNAIHCTKCHQDTTLTICQKCNGKMKKKIETRIEEKITDFEEIKPDIQSDKFRPPFVVRKVPRDIVARIPDAYDSHYNYIIREQSGLKSSRQNNLQKLRSHSPVKAKSMLNLSKTQQRCYACLLPPEEVRISCDACNLTARGEPSYRNYETIRPEPPMLRTYREIFDQRPIYTEERTSCRKCAKGVLSNGKQIQDDFLCTSSRPLYMLDGYRDMAKYFAR